MNIIDRLREGADRLGVAGAAGVALIILAAAVHGAVNRSVAAQVEVLRAEVAAARTDPVRGAGRITAAPASTAQQLKQFIARFPRPEEAAQGLTLISQAAQGSGITLLSGEYRMEQRPDDIVRRYRVVLPVQGSYAQLRGFIDRALADVPWAALDEIEMRRDSAPGSPIQARLRLTLYLQSQP